LLYNIGNVYFALGDFGKAIAYYRRAEQYLPRDGRVIANLTVALEKANVEGKQIHTQFMDFVGMRWLSQFERMLLIVGVSVLSLLLFSLNLWLPGYGFRGLWWVSMLATLCVMVILCVYAVVAPMRAVVLRQTPLQKESSQDTREALILMPGEMVEIAMFDSNKQYAYVKNSMNIQGFVKVSDLTFLTE